VPLETDDEAQLLQIMVGRAMRSAG